MKTKFFALVALVLGMASCTKDFAPETNVGGGEVDFTLRVSAPELATTRAGEYGEDDGINGHNSAYGAIDYLSAEDWNNADLRYILEVYDYDATGEYSGVTPIKDRQVQIVGEYAPVTFELRLVQGRKYHFVVFADFVPQGASADLFDANYNDLQAELGKHHIIGETLADIKVKRTVEDGINNEFTDAYFGSVDYTPDHQTHNTADPIVLTRPYAKVRVVATDLHELNINVEPKHVEVKYYSSYPTAFNALNGNIAVEQREVTEQREVIFTDVYNEGVSKENLANHYYNEGYDKDYRTTNAEGDVRHTHMTLFTDYILAKESQESVQFTMTVRDANNGIIKSTDFLTEIPVQRNHLTTIIGNVLTTATDVHVSINDNFENEEEVFLKDIDLFADHAEVYSANGLLQWAYIVNNGATDALRAVKDFNEANFDRKKYGLKVMANITLPAYEFAVENDSYVFTDKAITLDSENRPSGSNWPMVSPYPTSAPYVYYSGVIDGNGKTISGLRMAGGDTVYGFVGCMHKGAVVKNITFKDARVHAESGIYSAIVVGWNCDGATTDGVKLVNSSIYDSCPESNSNHATGGIVGQNQRRAKSSQNDYEEVVSYVLNCSTDADCSVYCANKGNVGGICGYNYGATIYNCVNAADVAGVSNVGGIAGIHRDYTMDVDGYMLACKCTADATISSVAGNSSIGGIAGDHFATNDTNKVVYNTSGWIVACYSEAKLSNGGAVSGNMSAKAKMVGSWAIKNGVSNIAGTNAQNVLASYIYNNAAEATQVDVDAMNDAIEVYNAAAIEPEHPVLNLRWVLTADGPVLQ